MSCAGSQSAQSRTQSITFNKTQCQFQNNSSCTTITQWHNQIENWSFWIYVKYTIYDQLRKEF